MAVSTTDLLLDGAVLLAENVTSFPILGYLMCILGYSLILYLEKVAFANNETAKSLHSHSMSDIGSKNRLQTSNSSLNLQNPGMSIYLLAIALSVHSIFEGLALGL